MGARIQGDEAFVWENIPRRFKALETFHAKSPEGVGRKYADPEDGGSWEQGPVVYAVLRRCGRGT